MQNRGTWLSAIGSGALVSLLSSTRQSMAQATPPPTDIKTAPMKLALYAVSLALVAFWAFGASAQQICKRSGEIPASNSTYPQRHTIDVGDVPGHQIVMYEVHRIFPKDTPKNCEGLRIVEQWGKSFADYTDGNGRTWGYVVYGLENGDKIFSQSDGTVETGIGSDGSKTDTYAGVTKITGGTGKYVGIRGLLRTTVKSQPGKPGTSETSYDMEYWFQK